MIGETRTSGIALLNKHIIERALIKCEEERKTLPTLTPACPFQLQPVSSGEVKVSSYLEERRIADLLNFLIGHLTVERPDEPLSFLHELLDKCLLFRAGLIDPPLLFRPK
jgi:hypothetical protein